MMDDATQRMLNPERPSETLAQKAARLATLPPPGPALTLHEAAAKLRTAAAGARAEMASNDYWGNGWAAGVQDAIGGEAGFLAVLLDPDAADEMADWLDATAAEAVRHAAGFGNLQEEITDGYPTALALRVLGVTQ